MRAYDDHRISHTNAMIPVKKRIQPNEAAELVRLNLPDSAKGRVSLKNRLRMGFNLFSDNMKQLVFFGALLSACMVVNAAATLIASDDFESYSDGASINGLSGGTGWTGNWSSIDGQGAFTGKIASGGIPGFGQSAALSASGGTVNDNEDIFERTFPSQVDPNTDLYVGLVLRTTGPMDDDDFLQFFFNQNLSESNGTGLSAGIRNRPNNPYFVRRGGLTQSTDASLTHQNNDRISLVIRLGKSGTLTSNPWNEIALFVNQPTEGTPDVARDSTASGNGQISSIGAFQMRMFSFEDTQTAFVDSIRIATTYGEAVTTIPEPSSLLLIAAGVLPLLRRLTKIR